MPLQETDVVLDHIPNWLVFGKQCRECLLVQPFAKQHERCFGEPAIVELIEAHDSDCSRAVNRGKRVRFKLQTIGEAQAELMDQFKREFVEKNNA